MFDAGALTFKLQAIGAQIFKRDMEDADRAIEKAGKAAQSSAPQLDKLGTSTDTTSKKAKASKAPLEDQAKSTKKVGDESEQASKKQTQQSQSTEQQIASAKELSRTLMLAGAAVGAMVTLSVAKSTEFEQAMSNVGAATMATVEDQKALGEAALEAGADTAYSASEAAAAEEELAKAGQEVSDIVGGSLNASLALAAAGQLQVARSAEIMATAMTQFRIPAEDAAHVSDVLAAGAGKAQGSVDDLALALSYVGPIAGSVGFSLDETAGALAYFATQGIIGEKAGTSLRGVLASLQAPSALADKEMKNYNISMFDANGNMLSLSGIAEQLRTRLSGLSEQERLAAMGRIFGNESLSAATLLYEGGAQKVEEWTEKVNDTGYAAEQAAMRQDNLAGDIEKLGGAFDTALIKTGTHANDVLRGMVQGLTELVDVYGEAPEPVQATATVLGVAAGAMLLFSGAAVGARAKFLELKTTLDKTNTTFGKTAAAGAAAGIALTGVLAVVGGLMARQAAARASAESYADALRQTGDAADEAARDLVAANLSAKESFLWMESDSAYDAAEKLGLSIDLVTEAAEGNADAQSKLREELAAGGYGSEEFKARLDELGLSLTEYSNLSTIVQQAIERETAAREQGRKLIQQHKDATGESTEASKSAADAFLEEADAAEGLENNLSDLIDAMNRYNDIGQDANSANIDYQNTLRDMDEQIKNIRDGVDGFGKGIDATTQAGADNREMLQKLAEDSQQAARAQFDLDGNTQAYIERLKEGRQQLYENAREMGATEEAAWALADQIYQIPPEKEIKILADTKFAQEQIDRYVYQNSGREIIVKIGTSRVAQGPGGGGGITQADGGVVTYYANGAVEHHVAQIARAGEWRVWAEPETGGESYVPHAPSKRARSEEIMAQTARILGGQYIPAGAARFADGDVIGSPASAPAVQVILSPKGGINLLDYIDVKIQQGTNRITNAFHA